MLSPRLLRHALDFTSADRILLSGDHPFHRLDAATIADFLQTLPDRDDRQRIAGGNAEALFNLAPSAPAGHDAPGGRSPASSG